MTDTSDLVKRLNEILQADLGSENRESDGAMSMVAIMPFPQFDRITDERKEAAQAIERLERERDELDAVVEQRNAECSRNFKQLADARAREEHVKNFIAGRLHTLSCRSKKPLEYTSLNRILGLLSEAVATPTPMDELQRLGQEYDAAPSKEQEG